MKFAFFTLGCKVNLFETQALSQLAVAQGHEIVERDADAVIVNTCTVTSASDHKNIRAFHKLRRDNPKAVIAACGCFAETEPAKVRATGEVDIVCGTRDRAAVLALCEQAVQGMALAAAAPQAERFELLPAGVPQGRTRALLKIEDGCDNYCTYCIIPYARGHVRSMPREQVESEVCRLERAGVREIVLTGIELSSYGRDLHPATMLVELLDDLLSAHSALRFRLGSLDPRTVDADFCERLRRHDNLARHFHLSLQSGSDGVLKRMGRRYTTDTYYKNVQLLRAAFPDCSITTDLITGFPGETAQELTETLAFLERCAFASVHVFPYSERAGTRAAQMEDGIPRPIRTARAEQAKQLAARLSERYREGFVGRELAVLPEHRAAGGLWAAHGTYGFPIYVQGDGIQKNQPIDVRMIALHQDGIRAEKI